MTEALAVITPLAPAALIAVDLWGEVASVAGRLANAVGGDLPDLGRSASLAGGWRSIRVEPTAWWLTGPLDQLGATLAAVEAALGDDGVAVDLSGGFAVIAVAGPAWRTLLMFGGVFDAEDPGFGPGATAGTLLHHAAVRYDVIDDARVHIHVAPSFADDLLHALRDAAAGL